MFQTVVAGMVFFALAVLGLSIGVILKKKTPLKGSCHSAAAGGAPSPCSCSGSDGHCDVPDDDSASSIVEDVKKGNFSISSIGE